MLPSPNTFQVSADLKSRSVLNNEALQVHSLAPGDIRRGRVNAAKFSIMLRDPLSEVSGRLDDALRVAIARVAEDPDNVAAIVHHLGWDGGGLRGPPVNLVHERAEEAASRAIERLREDGFVPDAVERSIALIESSLPLLDTEACASLMESGLCFKRLSCEALSNAARCFRGKAPFAVLRLGRSTALVKPGGAAALDQLTNRVVDLMHSRGCANMTDLSEYARSIFGAKTSSKFIEAALRAGGAFEWLDQDTKWFWYLGDHGHDRNRLVHQIQRVLAATPRIQLAGLRSAIRRDNGFGGFAPPTKVLEYICRHLMFLRLEGDTITRLPRKTYLDRALTSDEKILVEVLQSHGPALNYEPFLEHCRDRGLDEIKFRELVSNTLILDKHDGIGYSLVGAKGLALVAAESDGGDAGPVTCKHGFIAEQLPFIAWRLDATAIHGGVLRIPRPVSAVVEADYRLKALGNGELGSLHLRQRACWDVRRVLTELGGDPADTFVLVFNLRDRTAVGIIGGDDVVTRVVSNWPQLAGVGSGRHKQEPDGDRPPP